MARLKLIQYLNDPSLLEQISEEEMISWSKEVPYAGLVQRLLAQKLAIENSKKVLADKATTMAILSNANPDQVITSIEDFKNLILNNTKSSSAERITEEPATLDSTQSKEKEEESDAPELTNEGLLTDQHKSSERGIISVETVPEIKDHEERVHEVKATKEIALESLESSNKGKSPQTDLKEIEMSEFSEWLISLQTLNEEDPSEGDKIELEDKDLASDALAQLLVSQGHYSQAIAMYEILMLKVPQKSSFFADQIQKLKSL